MLAKRSELRRQQGYGNQQQQQNQQNQQQQQQQQQDPATLMEVIRNDPTTIDELSRGNPELLEAVLSNNLERFKRILEETTRNNARAGEAERREEEYQRLLASADPFDPVAQGKIAEYIRQKNVEENYVSAIEHNPESFASVAMLYIDCFVNGVKMKAFVDSGAQSTIMSEKCAQACNMMHLLDTRFAGIARGVGEAKILGRIHMADLKIGNSHFISSFTVMQQTEAGKHDLDFLLGLDNLKRHQSCIDLKENVLRIGNEVTPFLAEKDIPGHANRLHEEGLRSLAKSVDGVDLSGDVQPQPAATANRPGAAAGQAAANRAAGGGGGAPSPITDPNSETKIQTIISVTGATRQQAVDALRRCGGNVDAAAQMLSGFF